MKLRNLAVTLVVAGTGSVAQAAVLHVSDSTGTLATVNSETGLVDIIGNLGVVLTDIAFDPLGNLFGLSFSSFYSVDAETAVTTFLGAHGVSGGNALVFGSDGTLYAGGSGNPDLFTIDASTGVGTSLGTTGFGSGGDLAFVGDDLFLAAESGELVAIDLADLGASAAVGPFGVANVFGIATDAEGTLFGVGGTDIFTVNTATGAAQDPVSYAGQGLGAAFGQSFFTEAGAPDPSPVPLPATGLLLAGALAGLGLRRAGRT